VTTAVVRPRLGIVPVAGTPDGGCPSLWELGGVPLVRRAVDALLGSGRVDRVLVVAEPEPGGAAGAAGAVRAVLTGESRVTVTGAEELRGRLAAEPERAPVVVHDAMHPLAPSSLVRDVVDVLVGRGGAAVGVVAVRPVTDTLKWVDAAGTITGTADREGYRVICSPQAYPAGVLLALLAAPEAVPGGPEADITGLLPGLAVRLGPLETVPAPQEVFRVADRGDLELAEALERTGQGSR